MIKCPKCGFTEKGGQYCARCGTRLSSWSNGKSARQINPLWIAGGILTASAIAILIIVILADLVIGSGMLQGQTRLDVTVDKAFTCGNQFSYSIQLSGSNGGDLAGQQISTYVDGTLLEILKTDQNGRLSSTRTIPSSWCGRQNNLSLVYQGDLTHKVANTSASFYVQIPTTLDISAPITAETGDNVTINVTLRNSYSGLPIANEPVVVTDEVSYNASTDGQGNAQFAATFNSTGAKSIRASFGGDQVFLPSQSQVDVISVTPAECSDSTVVGQCSKQVGYYCNSQKQLAFNCALCGCGTNLICYNSQCISQEQQVGELVSKLQESVVFVLNSYESGSGVILDQRNGQTVILTNRHVVQDAVSTSDVRITTRDNVSATATDIKVAPNQMDFAVIYVNGNLGAPATINYSEQTYQGEDVLAIGSPLGIQGSVSKGIISNFGTPDTSFLSYSTGTPTRYDVIQTDAPINPGNSGGGLFLTSDGNLIGMNEYIIRNLPSGQTTEGLNFAIDIKELQKLLPYENWQEFTPLPRCQDGTVLGSCSTSNTGYMCSQSGLTPQCQTCGCSQGYSCLQNNQCFYCPSNNIYMDQSGNPLCCPNGYTGWSGNPPFCCPPGTSGQSDGTCK